MALFTVSSERFLMVEPIEDRRLQFLKEVNEVEANDYNIES